MRKKKLLALIAMVLLCGGVMAGVVVLDFVDWVQNSANAGVEIRLSPQGLPVNAVRYVGLDDELHDEFSGQAVLFESSDDVNVLRLQVRELTKAACSWYYVLGPDTVVINSTGIYDVNSPGNANFGLKFQKTGQGRCSLEYDLNIA